jgi:hypothetical protein
VPVGAPAGILIARNFNQMRQLVVATPRRCNFGLWPFEKERGLVVCFGNHQWLMPAASTICGGANLDFGVQIYQYMIW